MSAKSLIEAFEVKPEKITSNDKVKDYEVFGDKGLLEEIRVKIVQNLIEENIPEDTLLEDYINSEIDASLEGYDLSNLERNHVFNLIQNEITGYGPITPLLEDTAITEIMVNAPDEIYVEIDGKIVRDESVSFINNKHIIRTIQRIVQPLGRTIDSANPMVDARLRDGSRLNAVIPPLSLKGPVLTIRKFNKKLESIDDLLRRGSLTVDMARFLEVAVEAKLNIIISGGTGTGKTFDWKLLHDIKRSYFLAGGLHAENVSTAIHKLHPFAVDVSSGIEVNGIKNKEKMTAFLTAVKKEDKIL